MSALNPEFVGEREAYGSHASQFVEWYRRPEGSQVVRVLVHGGYWRARYNLEHLRPLCRALASRGIPVASLEYRRLGEEGGGWPGTFQDVAQALQAVLKSSGAVPSLMLVGHSAGGQLALWAGSRGALPPAVHPAVRAAIRRVVALAPISDLSEASRRDLSGGVVRELLGGSPDEVPERYRAASPIELVPLGVPTDVLHGSADADVPYDLSPAYVERARAAGDEARLVALAGADHFDLITPQSRFWPQVREVLEVEG
jgi:acetyl esterase/lipase